MINDREHRILEDLERRTAADDPGFALRLAGFDPWARWRRAWRFGVSVPVVLVVGLLAMVALILQVSSLGVLFGGFRWLARAKRVQPRTTLRG